MHLEAVAEEEVHLGSQLRRFAVGERIHTENSYKYRRAEFEALLQGAGFQSIRGWSSPDEGYFVFYAS
jgi:uncharacterized SAM-dependent methyltransferase